MISLQSPVMQLAKPLNRLGDDLLPLLARLIFAAVLLMYYWQSGGTKLGDGFFGFLSPSIGAYAQVFPKAMEAAGFDVSQLSILHWAVVTAGTISEFLLPFLIVIGLLTRLSAIAMIGFIIIQSLTDLFGHGGITHDGTLGAWFDPVPDALILDQRAFWVLCLLTLVFKGAGYLSLDRVIFKNAPSAHPVSPPQSPATHPKA